MRGVQIRANWSSFISPEKYCCSWRHRKIELRCGSFWSDKTFVSDTCTRCCLSVNIWVITRPKRGKLLYVSSMSKTKENEVNYSEKEQKSWLFSNIKLLEMKLRLSPRSIRNTCTRTTLSINYWISQNTLTSGVQWEPNSVKNEWNASLKLQFASMILHSPKPIN